MFVGIYKFVFAESTDGEGDKDRPSRSSKKERFFWQYNVQAKGPKGQRLVLKTKQEDPHVLNEVGKPLLLLYYIKSYIILQLLNLFFILGDRPSF